MDKNVPYPSVYPPFFYCLLRGEDAKPRLPVDKPKKIVMLHGWHMDHASQVKTAANLWDTYGHSVLLMDFYGHGRSPSFQDYRQMDVSTLVQQVRKAIELVGWENEDITLSGTSLGASVSLIYTHKFPKHVERLVLIAPGGLSEDRWYAITHFISILAIAVLWMVHFLVRVIQPMHILVKLPPVRYVLGCINLIRYAPTYGLDQDALMHILKTKPLTYIFAENDFFHTPQCERLKAICKDINTIVVPGVGHLELCWTLDQREFHCFEELWHDVQEERNQLRHEKRSKPSRTAKQTAVITPSRRNSTADLVLTH